MSFERKYAVTSVRLESKEIVSLELLDETSVVPVVKTAVLRLGRDDYEALGKPTVGERVSLTVSLEKQ